MSRHSLVRALMGGDRTDMFGELRQEVDRVFGDFRPLSPFVTAGERGARLTPRIDVSEEGGTIVVEAELPGVAREDVNVEIVDDVLVIEGSKRTESEKEEKDYHLVERSSGQFLRRVPLGFAVDPDKVRATFDKGVLAVRIERPPETQSAAKRIEIGTDAAA